MIAGSIARQTAGTIKDIVTGTHPEATDRRT
jgi:hypothetical protein